MVKASPDWLKKEIQQAKSSNYSEHFYNSLSEKDKIKLESEQTFVYNVLGIKGMYAQEVTKNQEQMVSENSQILLMFLKAKDDNLLFLIGGLLYTVIRNKGLLSAET